MRGILYVTLCLSSACGSTFSGPRTKAEPMTANAPTAAPLAKRVPYERSAHGGTRIDPYQWMEKKDHPDVLAHLEAENAYANAVMAETEPLQKTLYDEALARIKQTDLSLPVRDGAYWHYSRTEEGLQYPIHARKRGSLDAEEEIVLDLNELAKTREFVGIGEMEYSDDDRYLAYTIDSTGFRDYQLQVVDTASGTRSVENRERVTDVAWSKDGKTLFYVVTDHAKRPFQLYRHRFGEGHESDVLLYEETDERFRVSLRRSRSKDFLFVTAVSHTTSEVRFLPAGNVDAPMTLVRAREQDHEYYLSHRGDEFFIRTNDQGRNFRIAKANIKTPSSWTDVLAHDPGVMRNSLSVFRDFMVVGQRQDGLPAFAVFPFGKRPQTIPVADKVYWLSRGRNPDFNTATFRYAYGSPTTATQIRDYTVATGESEIKKATEVLGGYQAGDYETERLTATAPDGATIGISLITKKGVEKGPLLLIGYGSYGMPYDPSFSHARVSLLDRGVQIAFAHVRGGGEMGQAWHDAGRMFQKKNTFQDFIAVAEHLVKSGRTTSDQLAISGGSAGGLLMGAVVNARPDLFRAVIANVPFVDVLNTMSNDQLPLTVGEYEEWGNPNVKAEHDYIASYCPYQNIKAQAYPTILALTSYNDSQVMYHEPAKWVAKLRHVGTGSRPILFRTNMAGGHGGSSGRYDKLRETAFQHAFILRELGVAP